MRYVMVRYKVKAERRDEHVAYIDRVFEELRRERPAGLDYAAFQLDDRVSFVHLAAVEATDGTNPLSELKAFKAFTERIKERCDEPPVATTLAEVGAYRGVASRSV